MSRFISSLMAFAASAALLYPIAVHNKVCAQRTGGAYQERFQVGDNKGDEAAGRALHLAQTRYCTRTLSSARWYRM